MEHDVFIAVSNTATPGNGSDSLLSISLKASQLSAMSSHYACYRNGAVMWANNDNWDAFISGSGDNMSWASSIFTIVSLAFSCTFDASTGHLEVLRSHRHDAAIERTWLRSLYGTHFEVFAGIQYYCCLNLRQHRARWSPMYAKVDILLRAQIMSNAR